MSSKLVVVFVLLFSIQSFGATVTDVFGGTRDIETVFVESYPEAVPPQGKFRVHIIAKGSFFTILTSSISEAIAVKKEILDTGKVNCTLTVEGKNGGLCKAYMIGVERI